MSCLHHDDLFMSVTLSAGFTKMCFPLNPSHAKNIWNLVALDWELIKEGDEIILEGKNIKLSHVNHVPNSIADKTTLHRQGWLL